MSQKSGSLFDMQFITSCISTMLVLLLLGMVVFFVMTANNLSVYVRENINFSVLLNDDMKEAEAIRFQKQLEEEPFVKQATYISKAQALKEQTEAMGTDPAEFLGYNPFTASIEIKLNAAYANSDSLDNKKVIEVNYPQDLIDTINQNIRKISMFLLGLAALLTLISFALINNTIRLTIYSKRFLIHTMKLVGASWTADHLLQTFSDSHHEAGRCKLVIHPTTVHCQKCMDRHSCGGHGQCPAYQYVLHARQL